MSEANWPAYASLAWGEVVTTAFGGQFEIRTVPLDSPSGCPRRYRAPLLRGGQLAEGGFVCGHIGYGGVYEVERARAAPLGVQLRVLRQLAEELGEPCLRFVSPPLRATELASTPWSTQRCDTTVKRLGSGDDLLASYAGPVRTVLRKALRNPGVRVGLLSATDRGPAIDLIHQTQARVGAAYLSPRSLVEQMIPAHESDNFLAVGVWRERELISVGLFVINHGQAAYYLNGCSEGARALGANYPMLDAALRLLALRRVNLVDLGFSHDRALAEHKRRWGGEVQSFVRLSNPR